MAETTMAEEAPQPTTETTTIDMDVVPPASGDPNLKRSADGSESDGGGESKKQRVEAEEKSAEEERVENSGRVELGPKSFGSSIEMYDYFVNMFHHWPPYLNLNTYEHMVVLDLLNKGHPEPEKKIGKGVQAFQIRVHPQWKNKCFFIIRNDESTEDFSFRKCVDQILPLPANMQVGGGGGGRGGRGGGGGGGRRGGGRGRGHFRGGGRGRGGKPRN